MHVRTINSTVTGHWVVADALTRIAKGSPSFKADMMKYHMLTMKVTTVHASR